MRGTRRRRASGPLRDLPADEGSATSAWHELGADLVVSRSSDVPPQKSALARLGLAAAILAAIATFLALGTWQVQRRAWKLDLIAQVESRAHAAPVEAPGRAEWDGITAPRDAYRRVRIAGTFLNDRETLVQAVTERGPGFWVMTPLRNSETGIVLINRGFVPSDRRDPAARQAGAIMDPTVVTGLLRVTEPGGGFLRANDPGAERWHSRDVAAIAAARGLTDVAPYFVDADASPNAGGLPVGGLTVLAFSNHHLLYALTWYTLALLLAGTSLSLLVRGRRTPPGKA